MNLIAFRRTLELLFQNILQNAIKFVETETTPEVAISAIEDENSWRISIRDNGIGIKERFHKSIFEVFNRLHTADVYPGTGIGLAIAKKAATLHGGQISVESKSGAGSSFHITIPKHILKKRDML